MTGTPAANLLTASPAPAAGQCRPALTMSSGRRPPLSATDMEPHGRCCCRRRQYSPSPARTGSSTDMPLAVPTADTALRGCCPNRQRRCPPPPSIANRHQRRCLWPTPPSAKAQLPAAHHLSGGHPSPAHTHRRCPPLAAAACAGLFAQLLARRTPLPPKGGPLSGPGSLLPTKSLPPPSSPPSSSS